MPWVAGNVLTAAQLNTYAPQSWSAYTPAMTQWTLGNGTLTGRTAQHGKTVHFSLRLTIGSTTSSGGSGIMTLSLPVAAEMGSSTTAFPPIGWASLRDVSAPAQRQWMACLNSTSTFLMADDSLTPVQGTTPWTWATGDLIVVNGSYEAA